MAGEYWPNYKSIDGKDHQSKVFQQCQPIDGMCHGELFRCQFFQGVLGDALDALVGGGGVGFEQGKIVLGS